MPEETEPDYKKLIESSPDGFALFERGELKYISPSYPRLLGYEPGAVGLEEILSRLHPEDAPRIGQAIAQGRAQKLTEQRYSYRSRHADGHYLWMEDHIRREFDENGEEVRAMINSREIGQLKQTQAELEEALQAKDLLLSELNHRVKNNMAMIATLLDLESMDLTDPATREVLGRARERIASMSLLYEQLYKAGQVDRVRFDQYLSQLLETETSIYGNLLAQVEVRSRIEPADLPFERATQLALIFHELLTNAVKYAFENTRPGQIEVDFWREDGADCLSVADNGRGIAPDFSLEKSSGFGLKMIESLVERAKGRLLAERTKPGSRFSVILPG